MAEADAQGRKLAPDPQVAERAEHPESFDPGTETGYLRRGRHSHKLDPEVGAAPFDPGPQRYDGRRAKRAERRREKAERKRREKAERRERKREAAAEAERRERAGERLERRRAAPGRPAQRASLKRPTAKVGVALAAVVAVAVGAGVLIGLPLPLVGDSDGPDTSLAGTVPASLDPGTPTGLTKGPYHPVVVSNPNYGEAAAKFGANRGGRRHEGQDIFARPRTPLVAVRDGLVVDGGGGKSFYSYGGGNTLAIYSPLDDRSYIYLHMLKPALVNAGEQVKAGQLVGYVGCTGSCDGPHLHFEVRRGRAAYGPQKKAIDPLPLLNQWPIRPVDE